MKKASQCARNETFWMSYLSILVNYFNYFSYL